MYPSKYFWMKFICGVCLSAALLISFLYKDRYATTFLSDQIDQVMQFHDLAHGRIMAYYGPYMSGTNPKIYNTGPFGTIVLGSLHYFFGFDPSQIHVVLLCLVSASWLICAMLVPYKYLALYLMTFALLLTQLTFWFLHGVFWVNTLLVPLSMYLLVFWLRLSESRSWQDWICLAIATSLGLQVHSSAAAAVALLTIGLLLVHKSQWSWRQNFWPVFTLLLVNTPYLYAEFKTRFSNARNAFANIGQGDRGWDTGLDTVYSFPSAIIHGLEEFGITTTVVYYTIQLCFLGYFASRFFWSIKKRRPFSSEEILASGTIFFIGASAAFFVVTKRKLQSEHYLTLLIPWLWLPLTFFLHKALTFNKRTAAFAPVLALCLFGIMVVKSQPKLTTLFRPENTYPFLRTIVHEACKASDHAFRLQADIIYLPYNKKHPNAAQFIINDELPDCKIDDDSPFLLVLKNQGRLKEVFNFNGIPYEQVQQWSIKAGLFRKPLSK